MPTYQSFSEMMKYELPEIKFRGIQWTPERGKIENCPCWDQCFDVYVEAESVGDVREAMHKTLSVNACAFVNIVPENFNPHGEEVVMYSRDRAERLLKEYIKPNVISFVDDERVKHIIASIIEAVKEECCSGDGTPVSMNDLWGAAEDNFKQPQKIQGYTAEQWQEIIDGGYLCEFSVGDSYQQSFYACLESAHLDTKTSQRNVYFMSEVNGNDYFYCRPAQIKGVMRPIFVEPVDDPYCHFFLGEDRIQYGYWGEVAKTASRHGATKYIEV